MSWKGVATALAALWLMGFDAAAALDLSPPWMERNSKDCFQNHDPDRRIRGCSRLLKHGDGLIPSLDGPPGTRESRAHAHNSRGLGYLAKGDLKRARADFSEAIRLKPDLARAYNNRAEVFVRQRDYARAEPDFDAAIDIDPKFADAYAGRAALLDRMSRPGEAEADAERAVKLAPKSSVSYGVRGKIRLGRGQFQAAIADLSEAIRLGGAAPSVYAARGAAYEKAGLRELALADYDRALDASPADDQEREAQTYAEKRREAAREDLSQAAGTDSVSTGERTAAATAPAESPAPPAHPAPQERHSAPQERHSAPQERRVALVIGNSAYERVPRLANPDADAQAFAAALQRLGFSEVVEKHDLGLAALTSALKDFGDLAADADWAVIYYAGHGIEVGGRNYLIPVDARIAAASHVDDEAIPLERVLAKAESARKLKLVILDACRVNPFAARLAGSRRSIGRGLARIEPAGGVLVAYAARDGAAAEDGGPGHSPFTAALLKHIAEPGLDIGLLFRKVRDTVLAETRQAQEPFTYGSLPGEALYFKTPGG
jgi:tetratricopeptide (TPR) repeat protein